MMESEPKGSLATFSAVTPAWERAMAEKRYHDAIMTAFVGYAACEKDKGEALACLIWIRTAIDALGESINDERLKRTQGEVLCSFCGQGPPEVEVVAGPNVFICVPCAQLAVTLKKGK